MISFFNCVIILMGLFYLNEGFDIFDQVHQLLILLVIVKRNDWNSILKLIEVRVGGIINQKHILKVTISQYSQVFYVNAFLCLPTVVSEQSMRNQFFMGIQMIQHNICVTFMTCCKYNDLTYFRQIFKQFQSMRPHIDPCINNLSSRELNL